MKDLIALIDLKGTQGIKLDELSKRWFCTSKHAKTKLRRLEELGLIRYLPGRGRGNTSRIECLVDFEDWMVKEAERLIKEGRVELIFDWLNDEMPVSLHKRLLAKMEQSFSIRDGLEDKILIPSRRKFASIDPLYANISREVAISEAVFEPIVRLENGKILPHLAYRFEQEDQLLRFYIRKGIELHDGRPLTGEIIKQSYIRLMEASSLSFLFDQVKEIRTPHPLVVEIETAGGTELLLSYLARQTSAITPDGEIGTGPFKLQRCEASRIKLRAFGHHHFGRPLLDVIDFRYLPDLEADAWGWSVNGEAGDVQETSIEEQGARYLILNPKLSYQQRATIAWCIDKERFLELGEDRLRTAYGFLPSLSRRQVVLPPERFEFDRPLSIYHLPFDSACLDAVELARQLARSGIASRLVRYELADLKKGTFDEADLMLCGEMLDSDPDLAFVEFWQSPRTLVGRRFGKMEGLKQLLAAYNTTSRAEWKALHLAVERWMQETSYILPLYHAKLTRRFPLRLGQIEIGNSGWPAFAKLEPVWPLFSEDRSKD
ncbi:ABC transporter substrate-binding protein [Exiguobacterium flavidum]|uniref:ABC transporter substrate-binding protein n=1 Tax=Exiguobacterium flavidum TaxID=2184695 RepID=UPI0018E56DDB|nr:ABC transporter substrate-binding protein [Exiguobacterium flavidum]